MTDWRTEESSCEYCGKPMKKEHFNQKYHKKCRKKAYQIKGTERQRRFRKKYGIRDQDKLGTINCGRHMKEDPLEEAKDIQRMKRQIGLR